jgi:hypothetical protein
MAREREDNRTDFERKLATNPTARKFLPGAREAALTDKFARKFVDKATGFFTGKETPFVTDPNSLIGQEDRAKRFNIETPTGRRFFDVDPVTGRSRLNIEETEFQRGTRGQREALATDFLSSLGGGEGRFADESKRIGDLTFERGLSRLEPFLEKRRRQTETALASQGLPVGSEARSDRLAELSREESDRLATLAGQSELAASAEQSRLRDLALKEASVFAPELGGIDTSFFGNVESLDPAGITQRADVLKQNRAKLEEERRTAGIGRLGEGIGTAAKVGGTIASMFSDRRLKKNIKPVGRKNGFNIYDFEYKGIKGKYRGVIAQEVEKIIPQAVETVNGIKKVFYDLIGIKMEKIA